MKAARLVTQQTSDIRTRHALRNQRNAVQTVIVTRLPGAIDLLSQPQRQGGIGHGKRSHVYQKTYRHIMRN